MINSIDKNTNLEQFLEGLKHCTSMSKKLEVELVTQVGAIAVSNVVAQIQNENQTNGGGNAWI